LPTSWYDRSQYGNIIKNIIKSQYKIFQKTRDTKLKLNLSKNLAYLIQAENSLINDRYKDINQDLEYKAELDQAFSDEKTRQKLFKIKQRQEESKRIVKEREKHLSKEQLALIAEQRKLGLIVD